MLSKPSLTRPKLIDMAERALGIIETFGFVAAVAAADAGLKSAEVELLGCRYIGSGLVSVLFLGDVSSARAAVDAGSMVANQVGAVMWSTVIARTAEGLSDVVIGSQQNAKTAPLSKEHTEGPMAEPRPKQAERPVVGLSSRNTSQFDSKSVKELRELARQLAGFSLGRRQIRSARKAELIEALIIYYRKQEE